MADTIEEITIGSPTSLVAGDLTIDFTNSSVTGSLSTLVNGVQVPATGLTVSTVGGITTVNGTTVLGTGVSAQFSGLNPVTATTTVTALGAPAVTVQEAASVVCYASGTHIRTVDGEATVETLKVGDIVVTASGAHRPIRWIGHRAYDPRFANANPDLLPICVKAGAIAEGIPSRDLRLSPKHALYFDGVLIPAATLVNGVSIVKVERVDDNLVYWHVELDSHDVLVAENTPAESFVDDHGRGIFHNAATFHALYPDATESEAVYCAPRVECGHFVDAVRQRLARRYESSDAPAARFGELRGHVDTCDGGFVAGWARDTLYPDAPVCLDIVVDGELVAMTYAEEHRPDLAALGMGDGRFGFRLSLPVEPGKAHIVEIRRSADGAALASSPWSMAPAASRAA